MLFTLQRWLKVILASKILLIYLELIAMEC
jgi:hypothetical protein